MEATVERGSKRSADLITKTALKFMAFSFNNFERNRKYLKSDQGWINFSVGIGTQDGSVAQSIFFEKGRARVKDGIDGVSVQLLPRDISVLKSLASLPPSEVMNLLLKNDMYTVGNMAYLQFFNFLISVLLKNKQIKQMEKQKIQRQESADKEASKMSQERIEKSKLPKKEYMKARERDPGVKFLADDQYLSKYSLTDFPRLEDFLHVHFNKRPEICIERAEILTDWFKDHGFEKKEDGSPWRPVLRQAMAYKYLMENKKAIINENDLIAGTSTTKDIGVILYPDAAAPMIWGELLTMQDRTLNPYNIDEEDIMTLNSYILPYWAERNIREWIRDEYDNPLYQQLDERFAVYFLWKNVAISHTIIDFPKLLELGVDGIIKEIQDELKNDPHADQEKRDTLKAMILSYQGILAYGDNLAKESKRLADLEKNPERKLELEELAEICSRVPRKPSQTLDEAINAIWILWVAVHMENTNAGFSLGRMDQWLQPYFESDMEKIKDSQERESYIKRAIELVGAFYMRCTDHLPLIPDIGNYLFGGSSSDQAITLGGVDENGQDAVNDMTYIFLKVTEILAIRDPNVNARYYNGVNSKAYLSRLCEVNVNTAGTPSIHNDEQVINSMAKFNYPAEDVNDWAATGCVEPTISGKHFGHTNCMMFNMVSAIEMALNNGYHPLMDWQIGPKTGNLEELDNFDDFFQAFSKQLAFLGDMATQYNNILGEAHSIIRPTPMISAAIEGPIKKGRDLTLGGGKYNTSGIACIGLADVTDSLMAIKKMVYDKKIYSLEEIKNALADNFQGYEKMHLRLWNQVPRFGSGKQEAVDMANRVTAFVHNHFTNIKNFRGGPYTVGFWSMANHVAFGTLTGALPSGRLAYKPFTPGLTPAAHASKNLLDNIRDVAQLVPENMDNNIAFNVKLVPSVSDSHEETVNHLYSYAQSYCDLGGMQVQFNVLSSDTMRAAMANPDEYKDLMVRISGYNAYFVTLNREMQMELIERAEYGL